MYKRKEKTTPFGVSLMRSQVLNRAAQYLACTQAYMLLMFIFKPYLNESTEAIGVADLSCMLACLTHERLKSKQV